MPLHDPRGTETMTDTSPAISGYRYADTELNCSHDYLLPAVFRRLDGLNLPAGQRRLFELGCGNGSVAHTLTRRGWDVTGVDPSSEGIAQANRAHPELPLHPGSAYDDLAAQYGQFPVVLSLEVVEHVYFPRQYAATVFSLLQGGGYRHPVDALSRLLEKPGAGAYRQDGRALHRAVGPRPHQVLVDAHPDRIARRSRLPRDPLRAGRARPALGQVDDRGGAATGVKSSIVVRRGGARDDKYGHGD
jgi:2-polyprenyl-6-hydroxyphenyl methylase/3-demethylubiquinone-9 3-methyltransferase